MRTTRALDRPNYYITIEPHDFDIALGESGVRHLISNVTKKIWISSHLSHHGEVGEYSNQSHQSTINIHRSRNTGCGALISMVHTVGAPRIIPETFTDIGMYVQIVCSRTVMNWIPRASLSLRVLAETSVVGTSCVVAKFGAIKAGNGLGHLL